MDTVTEYEAGPPYVPLIIQKCVDNISNGVITYSDHQYMNMGDPEVQILRCIKAAQRITNCLRESLAEDANVRNVAAHIHVRNPMQEKLVQGLIYTCRMSFGCVDMSSVDMEYLLYQLLLENFGTLTRICYFQAVRQIGKTVARVTVEAVTILMCVFVPGKPVLHVMATKSVDQARSDRADVVSEVLRLARIYAIDVKVRRGGEKIIVNGQKIVKITPADVHAKRTTRGEPPAIFSVDEALLMNHKFFSESAPAWESHLTRSIILTSTPPATATVMQMLQKFIDHENDNQSPYGFVNLGLVCTEGDALPGFKCYADAQSAMVCFHKIHLASPFSKLQEILEGSGLQTVGEYLRESKGFVQQKDIVGISEAHFTGIQSRACDTVNELPFTPKYVFIFVDPDTSVGPSEMGMTILTCPAYDPDRIRPDMNTPQVCVLFSGVISFHLDINEKCHWVRNVIFEYANYYPQIMGLTTFVSVEANTTGDIARYINRTIADIYRGKMDVYRVQNTEKASLGEDRQVYLTVDPLLKDAYNCTMIALQNSLLCTVTRRAMCLPGNSSIVATLEETSLNHKPDFMILRNQLQRMVESYRKSEGRRITGKSGVEQDDAGKTLMYNLLVCQSLSGRYYCKKQFVTRRLETRR